ncbi:MAG: tetratricopeptide repeat protein, partial [Candidatus Omnitrophica bacterium]|nr:tetratricopeptide repeat protein [Candidatus Omnitrophota bacterium]
IFISFLTAILFGIHPLQVESVAWISERKGLLCTFFLLGSIISYFYYVQKNKVSKYYIYSLFLFVLALLSKGTAVILPVALLLSDYFVFLKRKREIFWDKIPFFILFLLFTIITIYARYVGVDVSSAGLNTILDKIKIASYCVMFYLNKIFIPINLSCVYTYPAGKYDSSIFAFLISLFLIFALLAAMIMSLKYTKKFFLAIALFLVSILPALQFVPVGRAIVADRYIYFPSIWVFYIISVFIVWIFGKTRGNKRGYSVSRIALIVTLFLSLVSLVFITQNRAKAWKDSISLWNEALRVSPSAIANNHLGLAYQMKGDFNRAVSYYTAAIYLDPKFFKAYNNRGIVYQLQGELEKAIIDYSMALEINPRYFRAYRNRARVYYLKRVYNKSWEDVSIAEKLGQKMDDQFIESLKKASGREN